MNENTTNALLTVAVAVIGLIMVKIMDSDDVNKIINLCNNRNANVNACETSIFIKSRIDFYNEENLHNSIFLSSDVNKLSNLYRRYVLLNDTDIAEECLEIISSIENNFFYKF